MTRKMVDCRKWPNEVGCTLQISGEEQELEEAAAMHGVAVHGETDTPEFREQIRAAMEDEKVPAAH